MAAKFKFARYDFANNLNVPEEAFQERKMEALLHKGWAIVATDLTDVYLSVLWQQENQDLEQPSQPAADLSQELHQAQQDREHAVQENEALRRELDAVRSELQQVKELASQLEARQGDAPASVQIGAADQPAEVNIGEVQQ